MPSFTIFSVLGLVSHNRALRSRGCSGYYQFHCYGILWHAGNLIYSTVFKQFQMSNCDIAISKNSYKQEVNIKSFSFYVLYGQYFMFNCSECHTKTIGVIQTKNAKHLECCPIKFKVQI